MKKITASVFMLTVLLSLHATAEEKFSQGQLIKVQEQVANINNPNSDSNSNIKNFCGFTVPVTAEPDLVLAKFGTMNKMEIWDSFCGKGREGMSHLCREGSETERAAYKKLTLEKIKKIHCVLSSTPKAIDISFKDGTMTLSFGVLADYLHVKGKVADFIRKTKF